MRSSSWIVVSALSLIILASCASDDSSSRRSHQPRYGYQGEDDAQTQFASPSPSPSATPEQPITDAMPTPSPSPMVSTPGGGGAGTPGDLKYGTPVPGKAGFVTSPHAPYAGFVDVRGFPPGTEVKCPYTGKIFLVP